MTPEVQTKVMPSEACGVSTHQNEEAAEHPLIAVERLSVHFAKRRTITDLLMLKSAPAVRAVDGVELAIAKGETLGLVGESGSGKTTIGRTVMRLIRPSAGRVLHNGQDIARLDGDALRQFRRRVQMVFQDPYSSLNPRLTVRSALAEVLRFHGIVPRQEEKDEVERLMSVVGMHPSMATRRPKELSGGQRQRVGLARALAVRPDFLVLDEPVAALDVSIQAQVLNLLKDLRDRLGLTVLFIAHGLGVIRHMSDRVAVLYLGRVVETGTTDEIFDDARHPYTRGLLEAAPRMEPVKRQRKAVFEGEIPSALALPTGCRFRTRCPLAAPICETEPPEIRLSQTHMASCHFAASSQSLKGDRGNV